MKEHINLIIDERATPRGDQKVPLESMVLPGVILVFILALGFSYVWQAKRAAGMEARVKSLQVQRDGMRVNMDQLAQRPAHMQDQAQSPPGDVLGPRTDWGGIIREISWIVPEGIYLTTLDSRGNGREESSSGAASTVKFTGNAISHGAIARFLSKLEGSGRFEHVALVFAEKKQGAAGGLIGFEITGELKNRVVRG